MTLANRITVLRLLMGPIFAVALFHCSPEREWLRYAALAIYAAAALSDFVDGYIARRFGQETKLGERLDPLADKITINLGFIFVAANEYFQPGIPAWFPVVVLGRDAIMVVAAYIIHTRVRPIKIKPRLLGKLTTITQITTLVAALLQWPFTPQLVYLALAATLLSFADYVYIGLCQARRATV